MTGTDLVAEGSARTAPEPMARPRLLPQVPNHPLTPPEVYAVLSRVRPPDSVIVNESTSTMALSADTTTVIVVRTQPQQAML
jgi:benzoylformate decarboxylase